MDKRSIVPIVRQPQGRQSDFSLLENEDPTSRKFTGRTSPNKQDTKRAVIQPDTQTYVKVVTSHKGLILVH